jgi:hypothetical protein
MQLPYTLFKF